MSIFVSYVRYPLTPVKPFGLPIVSSTAQSGQQRWAV